MMLMASTLVTFLRTTDYYVQLHTSKRHSVTNFLFIITSLQVTHFTKSKDQKSVMKSSFYTEKYLTYIK